jgi:hypothetical protein
MAGKQGEQSPNLEIGPGQSIRRKADDTGFETYTPGAGGAVAWGDILGSLSAQGDLNSALNNKVASDDARLSDDRTPLVHGSGKHSVDYQQLGFTVLANDTLAQALATNINTKLTVTASRTLTTTVPAAGVRCSILILTSGTTSYTITFGTGFKTTGTLATGTVSGRIFVINFFSTGTVLYEAGRTAAMAA